MKSEQMMFIKIFMQKNFCLMLVIIHKIQTFFDHVNNEVIAKMKDDFKGYIISEFVGLKSYMDSLIAVDGEESLE